MAMTRVIILTFVLNGLSSGDIFNASTASRFRRKRVLLGKPIWQRDVGYDVVLYFTWLGMGHTCPTGFQAVFSFILNEDCVIGPSNLLCGGSLVTPDIVLTAAHCLSSDTSSVGLWSGYKVKSEWESIVNTIVGYNDLSRLGTFYGVRSKKFIVHQKYSTLRDYGLATHDYGWIVLQKSFPTNPKWYKVAPLYNKATHAMIFQNANAKQWACLYVGFGLHERVGQPSAVLRHGWGMLNEYYDTYQEIKDSWFAFYQTFPFAYRDHANWSWLRTFGQSSASLLEGDSGSPITCNNYHYAVAAGYIQSKRRGTNTLINAVGSLAFIPYESSSEYRRAFIQAVEEYKKSGKIPTFEGTFTPFPDTTKNR